MEKLIERLNLDRISLAFIGQSALKIVAVLIAVHLGNKFLKILIDRFFQKQLNSKLKVDTKKITTMSTLAKSVVTYTLYFIGLTMIIAIIGIPPASILATAGIGGLAIGFGAQNLVRDVITGFFILLEDQYAVGDYITLDRFSGIVEEIGIRITKVRDFNGDLHIIPNGNISNVTNHCRGDMRVMFDVGIAYEEDVDKAIGVIENFFADYRMKEEHLTDGPKVLGVSDLADSSVRLRIWATSKPMEQWRIEREIKKGIKQALDEAGIEIPYQKRVILSK
ncbi:MAG: Potassium efflux system KefA protein / Small-conductance mechanosensitive channel [Firmicutes bacterium]|nr:Potassium efflux system KefA protein / Small-conductance mechanosensitive channel [Bacillota bacterium]MDI6705000.1 mechanosensitive ion channel family protein [Bacillota bacterium]